jgi:hypothetical protein
MVIDDEGSGPDHRPPIRFSVDQTDARNAVAVGTPGTSVVRSA